MNEPTYGYEELQLIQSTAVDAAGAKDKVQLVELPVEPDHVYGVVSRDPEAGWTLERMIATTPPREHTLRTVADLADAVKRYGDDPSVWISDDCVIAVLGDGAEADRRSSVCCRLQPTQEFKTLCELSTEKRLDHKALLRLLRFKLMPCLGETGEALLRVLRSVSFMNSTTGHSRQEAGRASYSREIEGEVKSNGGELSQFEKLTLSVRLFEDPALTLRRNLTVMLDDDPLEQSFALVPLGGELRRVLDEELDHIHSIIEANVEAALFRGTP